MASGMVAPSVHRFGRPATCVAARSGAPFYHAGGAPSGVGGRGPRSPAVNAPDTPPAGAMAMLDAGAEWDTARTWEAGMAAARDTILYVEDDPLVSDVVGDLLQA